MKAIGRNLIIEKIEEVSTRRTGVKMLAELHRDDIRYVRANVIEVGDEVLGLKKEDLIYYDRHAGHKIEIENKSYHVIKTQDVVVVL